MKKILFFVLAFMLVTFHYRLWISDSNIVTLFRLQSAIDTEKIGVEKLTIRNQTLDQEVQALKIRPQLLEDRARSELGMVRKGETYCLVVDPGR